jgi:hypothetical protein
VLQPKRVDPREVRVRSSGQYSKRHIFVRRARESARREDADTTRVLFLNHVLDRVQIELLDNVENEICEVVLRQPLAR